MTTIDDLGPHCLQRIFQLLNAKECASVACVQRSWRELSQEDFIWRRLFAEDWSQEQKVSISGGPLLTFREAYADWECDIGRYGLLAKRALHAWAKIEAFLRAHIPAILETLSPGVSESDLDAFESDMDLKLPPAIRVIYRFHDGQDLGEELGDMGVDDVDQGLAKISKFFLGLFGGYSVYNHVVNNRMLRLRAFAESDGNEFFLMAASFNMNKGLAYFPESESLRVVPHRCVATNNPGRDPEGPLRWFEHYAAELEAGHLVVGRTLAPDEDPQGMSRGILLYPAAGPSVQVAVTRGVRVTVSTVFMPECADPRSAPNQWYSYSVRFALLSAEEQLAAWPVGSGPFQALTLVQLMERHWIIKNPNGVTIDEIRGGGVIGQYPVLKAGGEEFVYQSQTSGLEGSSMEGDFSFVDIGPPRIPRPPFAVQCPKFVLTPPAYVF